MTLSRNGNCSSNGWTHSHYDEYKDDDEGDKKMRSKSIVHQITYGEYDELI